MLELMGVRAVGGRLEGNRGEPGGTGRNRGRLEGRARFFGRETVISAGRNTLAEGEKRHGAINPDVYPRKRSRGNGDNIRLSPHEVPHEVPTSSPRDCPVLPSPSQSFPVLRPGRTKLPAFSLTTSLFSPWALVCQLSPLAKRAITITLHSPVLNSYKLALTNCYIFLFSQSNPNYLISLFFS